MRKELVSYLGEVRNIFKLTEINNPMKRAIFGLAALVASSCASTSNKNVIRVVKSHDGEVVEEYVKGCAELTSDGIYRTSSGYGTSLPEIARVDKVLQGKTSCHLSVYFDRKQGDVEFVVVKGNPEFLLGVFYYEPRYVKLYPYSGGE